MPSAPCLLPVLGPKKVKVKIPPTGNKWEKVCTRACDGSKPSPSHQEVVGGPDVTTGTFSTEGHVWQNQPERGPLFCFCLQYISFTSILENHTVNWKMANTVGSWFGFPCQSWMCSAGRKGCPKGGSTFTHPLSFPCPVCCVEVANANEQQQQQNPTLRRDFLLQGSRKGSGTVAMGRTLQTHPPAMRSCLTA